MAEHRWRLHAVTIPGMRQQASRVGHTGHGAGRRGAARRALGRCLLLACALLAGWLAPAGALRAQPATLTLDQAQFAASAQGPWAVVALPDTWSQRGLLRLPLGIYRLHFVLAAVPAGPLALSATRLGGQHRLLLNGQLLHDTLGDLASARARTLPFLLQLPPSLLRVGDNWIELQVQGGPRAGLSPLSLGPARGVEHRLRAYTLLSIELPWLLNAASAGACLFALVLWWRRRTEAAMGWFGLLGLLASLRNGAYYSSGSVLPSLLSSLLFVLAQVVTVLLLGLFAMALAQRRPRGFRPLLLGGCALLMLAAALVSGQGEAALNRLRLFSYPLLGLLAAPSLWLIAQRVRSMRSGPMAALLLALAATVVAGGHDYAYQQGFTAVTDHWWLPCAMPAVVIVYIAMLIGRMSSALSQVEELNLTLERRVQERTQALASANAAKGRFLSAASHDLRQPLVTIGLLVGLLREQLLAPAQRAMVARVDEAVAAMESLLAGLLDLSRLDAGTLRAKPQRVALQTLFDAVAAHSAEAAQRKGLVLRVRPCALVVWADAVLLEQIVRTLVTNALRYTDAGGALLAARATADGQVRLQVWDTGRGIAPEQQARVFEEFVQLGNPGRDRSQGLGLGLTIVQRSAQLMGAALQLRSRPGHGSCFGLLLPASGLQGDDRPRAPSLPVWLAGTQLLLVEDDPAVRAALQARLQAWGAQVLAHDGAPALRATLAAWPPGSRPADLLLTDLRLADGDGGDAIALAQQHFGATLPVLVVTGNTAPDELARLQARGWPVLHKPFRADELRAALQRALVSAISR